MIQVAVTVGAVEAVFFVLSPLIALLAVTPIPLIIWGAFYFQRKAGLKGFRTTQTISSTGFRPCSVSRPRHPPNAGGVACNTCCRKAAIASPAVCIAKNGWLRSCPKSGRHRQANGNHADKHTGACRQFQAFNHFLFRCHSLFSRLK